MKIVNQPHPLPAQAPIAKTKHRIFVRLKRIALWFIASVATLAALGTAYQMIATEIDKRAYLPPGEMIDMGGYQIHLYCTGTNVGGSPTVILEQGLGGISSGWAFIQPEVAKVTRVCSYDRAGMGWSDASPERRDAQHIAQELNALLQNANIVGPYVLVGWSIGGLYARQYAEQYSDHVVGMVLLDSSHPDQWSTTSQGRAQFESNAKIFSVVPTVARLGVMRILGLLQPELGFPTPHDQALRVSFAATKDWEAQSAEMMASLESAAQVRESGSLDNRPLFVLTAAEQDQLWQSWQRDLASLSTNSIHQIVQGADHMAFWRDPEVVKVTNAAIIQTVKAAHSGEPLKP